MNKHSVLMIILLYTFCMGCGKESNRPLRLENVSKIEKQAKNLKKEGKDAMFYIDSLKERSANDNLSFYLEILSIKFNKKLSKTTKLEEYKKLANRSFLDTYSSFNKFKIRSEIASILLRGDNIYPGMNQMLLGISEIENKTEESEEPEAYKNLVVDAYSEIINAKSLNIKEKEYYTKTLYKYIPRGNFKQLYTRFYNLGYYNFENNEKEVAIINLRKSINFKPDSSLIDPDKIPDLLEEQKNFSWGNSYSFLIDCYSNQPDTAYKYIAKINELYKEEEILESTLYDFKIHILASVISIGDYNLAIKYIDDLLKYYHNSCGSAYYMLKIYQQKARVHNILKQSKKELEALMLWDKYTQCPRSHEYFARQRIVCLEKLIEFHTLHNNKDKVSYYQSLKLELLEEQLLTIKNQRENSKVWTNFEYEVEKNEDKYHHLVHQFQQNRFYLLVSILSIIGALLVFIFYLNVSLKNNKRKIEEKQNMLDETNNTLEKKNGLITKQNKNLNFQKTQIETELKENLLFINFLSSEIDSIVDDIKSIERQKNISLSKLKKRIERIITKEMTDNINLQFQEHHKEFVEKLRHYHPNLSASNIRLCILLKLNMNTKEISNIEGKSTESIKVARSRLRKKLMINIKDVTLSAYLNNTLYDQG